MTFTCCIVSKCWISRKRVTIFLSHQSYFKLSGRSWWRLFCLASHLILPACNAQRCQWHECVGRDGRAARSNRKTSISGKENYSSIVLNQFNNGCNNLSHHFVSKEQKQIVATPRMPSTGNARALPDVLIGIIKG